MEGACFRLPLGRRIAGQGTLEMELFARYLPLHFPLREVRFVDTRDQPIPVLYRILEQKVEHPLYRLLGIKEKYEILIADLSVWLRRQNVTRRDDLLVTVLDWQNGVLRLEIEPHKKQQPALIQARDRLLADLLYQILENAADESIWIEDALPLAYARLPEKEACSPHHWQIVLEQDGRFLFDDSRITYADAAPSPLERLILEQTGSPPAAPLAAGDPRASGTRLSLQGCIETRSACLARGGNPGWTDLRRFEFDSGQGIRP
jgi:PAS domain-containing protein